MTICAGDNTVNVARILKSARAVSLAVCKKIGIYDLFIKDGIRQDYDAKWDEDTRDN
jgi:hypothetical protein